MRTCKRCGNEFRRRKVGDFASLIYCSPECQRPPKAPKALASKIHIKQCTECVQLFTARQSRSKYCSAHCRAAANSRQAGLRIKDLYQASTAAREGGAGKWRTHLVAMLRERDGDCCQICDGLINFTVRSGALGSDSGVSIDHIWPRSKGGGDDLSNLRLAHWGCNRKRRNRVEYRQERLVH